MLIYDKKGDKIDVYSMQAQEEKIKKYREKIISNLNKDELLYSLTTNSANIISQIRSGDNSNMQPLIYSNGVFIDNIGWLKLVPMKYIFPYNPQRQKEIIAKYIEGEYDNLNVKSIIERLPGKNFVYKDYRLLIVENFVDVRNNFAAVREVIMGTKNVINLPYTLYLLYLLKRGEFSNLADANISEQLSLFDIDYLRSIKLKDIQDILSTGLLSGTMEEVIKKAEIGSKILKKSKIKR